MKRWIPLAAFFLMGACPARDNTYVAGTIIQPNEVMANEDALFNGIQNGLSTDCIADNAITSAKIATGAVTSADIADGTVTSTDLAFSVSNQILPSGAVFFMLTGSCPSWTTDVSSTYSNLFIRVNATAGTLAGSNTHTHDVGSFIGPTHTHAISDVSRGLAWSASSSLDSTSSSDLLHAVAVGDFTNATASSGGGGSVTGTSASADNVPASVSAKLCQVN